MTKTRIREIRFAATKCGQNYLESLESMIVECLNCITELQSRTRRGEPIEQPEELPLAAKVNPAKKARGTQAEILEYVADLDLTEDDAIWFFEKMTENEWKVGKHPVKDWRGRVRTWRAGKFFPSQKANGTGNSQHRAPARSVGPARCNL